jgi:hypothetical protein
VSIAMMLAGPVAGQPPMTHALIHIKNDSIARATLNYKWGKSGRWRRYIIERNRAAYFNWRYNGPSRSSPDFIVRLDSDTKRGSRCVEQILSRGASPDNNSSKYGHHYVIRQLPGTETRYIDAVTNGAVITVTDRNCST